MNYTNKIQALNPSDIPMINTDYYHWMQSGGYANNRITCKINYLRRFGFVKGQDKISADTMKTLNYIQDTFFRNVVLPRLK